MRQLESAIFQVNSDEEFNRLAIEVYKFQYAHCSVYRNFVDALGHKEPTEFHEIPFLPISFFKTHKVIDDNQKPEIEFLSSGTGGDRSHHFVVKKKLYETSFRLAYQELIGPPEEQVILALLPNYLDQGQSSLVYMVDNLISETKNEYSQFILNDITQIEGIYHHAMKNGKQVVLIGVSYALLDLAKVEPNLSNAIIIETGGMKGRRKELTKQELHTLLKKGLNTDHIYSEYGMTELLSQAYSKKDGLFTLPTTMKVLIRDVNDPLSYVKEGKTGGINIVDLSNLYSCSFIATQDLGKINGKYFELMGRYDHSDIRGCNLLVQ